MLIKKTWQPFFAIGLGAVQVLPYEIDYEFLHSSHELELLVPIDVRDQNQLTDFLLLHTGTEFKISKQFNWIAAIQYRHYFGKRNYTIPQLIGIQTGLNYKF